METQKVQAVEEAQEKRLYKTLGVDLEDLRLLLMREHGVNLSPDDPILMMVSIFNVCLEEQEQIFLKHQEAITSFLSSKTDQYSDDIKTALSGLNTTYQQISSSAVSDLFRGHADMLGRFKQSLWWPVSIAITSALINAAVLLLTR